MTTMSRDGWVLSPIGKKLLWLPRRWRSNEVYRTWGGRFLELLHYELPEAVILELGGRLVGNALPSLTAHIRFLSSARTPFHSNADVFYCDLHQYSYLRQQIIPPQNIRIHPHRSMALWLLIPLGEPRGENPVV